MGIPAATCIGCATLLGCHYWVGTSLLAWKKNTIALAWPRLMASTFPLKKFRDLRPDNLLLGKGFNLVLTYQCQWVCVDRVINSVAIEQMYAAPEICSFHQVITAAVDWWSYGVILFELLSGEVTHKTNLIIIEKYFY